MNDHEEFEKWAVSEGRSIKPSNREYSPQVYASAASNNALDGWQARQPEIDALKEEISLCYGTLESREGNIETMRAENRRLAGTIDNLKEHLDRKDADVYTLKAENERLRKDVERYRWLRERDLDTIDRGGVFAGAVPQNEVLNGIDLDEAIDAAMADKGE